jgi:hypothetical protein
MKSKNNHIACRSALLYPAAVPQVLAALNNLVLAQPVEKPFCMITDSLLAATPRHRASSWLALLKWPLACSTPQKAKQDQRTGGLLRWVVGTCIFAIKRDTEANG